jgi:beta-galactosidase
MGILRCLLAACILLSSFFCQGQTSVRKKINLDDNWKFKLGHAANPEKDFNYSIATVFSKSGGAFGTAIEPRFKDSAWRTLDLPHDWAVELPFVNVDNRDVESHGYKPCGWIVS